MKKLLSALLRLSALVTLLVPAAAQAGYVNDRRAWLALSHEARAGYVQGLNDSLNYIFADETLPNALAKKARNKCLAAQQTSAAILADRITTAYRDDRYAALAPTAVYIIKMQETCQSYINDERAQFGLGPL
jgi:hypothetical protein